MNRDDIIRMARESELTHDYMGSAESIIAFAKLVAAAEREECARLAVLVRAKQGTWDQQLVCEDIAIAIRARK